MTINQEEIQDRISAIEIINMIAEDMTRRNPKIVTVLPYKVASKWTAEIMYGERDIDFDDLIK